MRLLLDTNVCIDVLRGRPEVVKRLREHSPSALCVSAVTAFELIQGAGRAPEPFRAIEREKVNTFLAATALRMDIPFVTSNVRDFSKIKGLEIIDWRKYEV